jgi:hypothetical protein
VIPIASTIALSVAIGIGAERRFGERARRGARGALTGMLYTLVPFIAFFNMRIAAGAVAWSTAIVVVTALVVSAFV